MFFTLTMTSLTLSAAVVLLQKRLDLGYALINLINLLSRTS